MKLKRQPTLKTLLMLLALAAALFTIQSNEAREFFSVPPIKLPSATYVFGVAYLTEILFWIGLPLLCAVSIRSNKRVGLACLGVGFLAGVVSNVILLCVAYFALAPAMARGAPPIRDYVVFVIALAVGPVLFVFRLAAVCSGWFGFSGDLFNVTCCVLPLALYILTGVLVAKSCRLKEPAN